MAAPCATEPATLHPVHPVSDDEDLGWLDDLERRHAEDMAVNRGDDEPFADDEVAEETMYAFDDDALCDLMEEEET